MDASIAIICTLCREKSGFICGQCVVGCVVSYIGTILWNIWSDGCAKEFKSKYVHCFFSWLQSITKKIITYNSYSVGTVWRWGMRGTRLSTTFFASCIDIRHSQFQNFRLWSLQRRLHLEESRVKIIICFNGDIFGFLLGGTSSSLSSSDLCVWVDVTGPLSEPIALVALWMTVAIVVVDAVSVTMAFRCSFDCGSESNLEMATSQTASHTQSLLKQRNGLLKLPCNRRLLIVHFCVVIYGTLNLGQVIVCYFH